jgi:hypothetical protein
MSRRKRHSDRVESGKLYTKCEIFYERSGEFEMRDKATAVLSFCFVLFFRHNGSQKLPVERKLTQNTPRGSPPFIVQDRSCTSLPPHRSGAPWWRHGRRTIGHTPRCRRSAPAAAPSVLTVQPSLRGAIDSPLRCWLFFPVLR